MSNRWAIYIDIEGFSALWEKEDQVLRSLGELMRAIFRIGRQCYPREPDRLFAHQFGDGFLVASDFHEESLERCATIGIALMRHVAATGRLARASISEGELSDIQGCYPMEVRDLLTEDHTVSLHMGLMTINPVMGTALIRAVGVDKVAPRGPLIVMPSLKASRLGAKIVQVAIPDSEFVSIDWVHTQSDLLTCIQKAADLSAPASNVLESELLRYSQLYNVPSEWRDSIHELLEVPRALA